MGTTYRSGARFGPQAVRRISALYDSYSPDIGMDLLEEITIGGAGDISVIPSNIEKTFDQIDLLATLVEHGHLGARMTAEERARAEQERNRAAGVGPADVP